MLAVCRAASDVYKRQLHNLYPHLKGDEVELLLSLNSLDDLKQLAKDSGYTDKEIKEIF